MEISLNKLLNLFLKNIVCIIITALVFSVAAFGLVKFILKPQYSTSVKMYAYTSDVNQSQNSTISFNSNLSDLNYLQKIINTYIQMLETNSYFELVKKTSNTDYSVSQIRSMIKFNVIRDTAVFQILISAPNPKDAKLIADSAATAAIEITSSIRNSMNIKLIDPASLPTSPSNLNVLLYCILGFLLGLLVSCVFIIIKDILDIKIKSEEELLEKYNIPLLGCIPNIENFSQLKNRI